MNYKEFFGMSHEPFRTDIGIKDLMDLPGLRGAKERIQFALKNGGVCLLTGDVGLGKSTSLRASVNEFHPSQILVINVVANTGSITELYTQIAWELGLNPMGQRKCQLTKLVKNNVEELVSQKRQQVLLCIDEANLLRLDVLEELHTLNQFALDSKNIMSLVLCGQNNLLDKLHARSSAPLASRVVARHHLQPLKSGSTEEYINHHLKVAKAKNNVFEPSAVTTIFQGSGGILRRINNLARGALVAAAMQKQHIVTPEHVRLAQSETI